SPVILVLAASPLDRFAVSPVILVLAASPLDRFAVSPVILVLAASPLDRFAVSPVILVLAASPLDRFAVSPVILVLAASPLGRRVVPAGRRHIGLARHGGVVVGRPRRVSRRAGGGLGGLVGSVTHDAMVGGAPRRFNPPRCLLRGGLGARGRGGRGLVLRAVLVARVEHHLELVLRVDLAGELVPDLGRLLGDLVDHRDRGLHHGD